MLLRIALRNIWRHKVRTVIVGGLIGFGTILVICGFAVIDAVDAGMARSIVHSLAGHIQVYSTDAKDELSIYGKIGMGESDVGRVDDFAAVRDELMKLDNVASVVPMGINYSLIFGRNILDHKLEALRNAVRKGDDAMRDGLIAHLRLIIEELAEDLATLDKIAAKDSMDATRLATLAEVRQDAWWQDFAQRPLDKLEVLENDIAPLKPNDSMLFLRYVGTDPQAFKREFELFEVADGSEIPEGKRGLLINKRFYERRMKHRIAWHLDEIKKWRDEQGRTIATDDELQTLVKRNVRQYKTIVFELDPTAVPDVRAALQKELGSAEEDIDALTKAFLDMNDENFERRRDIFYAEIGTRLPLYRFKIGDYITMTSFTRGGYARSANVKLYGTYRFESLERSDLAGAAHIMDLISFRSLYGFVTPEMKEELAEMKDDSGLSDVAREGAEDALFGGDEGLVDNAGTAHFDEFEGAGLAGRRAEAMQEQLEGYTQAELDQGPVLNMAVFLKDAKKLEETRAAISAMGEARGLGLQTMSWHQASGIVGQFTTAMRLGLVIPIIIIFIVALIIINNSMVMATTERIKEIGTLRAIGGQRGFVLRMFLVETMVLCLVFGTIAAIIGSGLVLWMGSSGIPAFHEALYFLFAGPRLYPVLAPMHLMVAFAVIFGIAILSTFYPALIATRITPVTAMQEA